MEPKENVIRKNDTDKKCLCRECLFSTTISLVGEKNKKIKFNAPCFPCLNIYFFLREKKFLLLSDQRLFPALNYSAKNV